MRVLTFTSLFPNKIEPLHGIFIAQRIQHFAKRPSCDVRVIAPVTYFPRWLKWSRWKAIAQVPRAETIYGLSVDHPRYFLVPRISMPFHGLLMFLGSVLLARKLHKTNSFDCIDAHFVYPDGLAAVLLGKVLGIPVIVSARGTDVNLYPSFRLVRHLIRWTLKKAAGIVAVSASLKEIIVQLGLTQSGVRVIGNGIDTTRFAPVELGEARTHLGLPQNNPIIVSVGSLIPRKGYQFLIPAFAQIALRFPKADLYIIGDGKYGSELKSLASESGVGDRTHFVGNVPNQELRYWFSAASVSCLVSSREGWPNVLQESLACGTPVVATRLWGAPEIVTSKELGILVDQDIPAIAAALEKALERAWDRGAIARHASKRTWDVVAAEVEEYLSSCISERGLQKGKASDEGIVFLKR